MKSEDLFSALGKIDDSFIENAVPKKQPIYKKSIFKWTAAVAACLCVLVAGHSAASLLTARDSKLTQISCSIYFDGMGYEGTDELSLSNSQDINPWNENTQLETLPVYKNLCYNGGELGQTYFNVLELKKQAEELADKLGVHYARTQISISNSDEVNNFTIETDKGTIRAFPKSSNITVSKNNSFLIEKHMQSAFEMYNDGETVSGIYTEYSIDGELLIRETRTYCKTGNITDDIISFNMHSHYLTENGNYITGRSDDYLKGTEKMGDYPVISLQEAKQKLLKGDYVSSADESNVEGGKITEDVIEKVDLIYYTTGNQEYYLPFYRFYVKYSQGANDIQAYAYFYVCAVSEEYTDGITVFDGSFQ